MASPLSAQSSRPAQVRHRLYELTTSMRALVDATTPDADRQRAGSLSHALERLGAQLVEPNQSRQRLCDLLSEMGDAQAAVREHALDLPFRALGRIYDALARLRRESTSEAILEAAPRQLCAAGPYDRALLSTIRGSTWIPRFLHLASGADTGTNIALAEFVRRAEIPLNSGILEAELVRRRLSALVWDAQAESRVFRPLVEVSATTRYVVAPIVTGGSVVGLLHADCYSSRRPLTDLDRDNLQTFADGIGLLCERALLVERLAAQRERLACALAEVRDTTEEVGDGVVRLTRPTRPVVAVSLPVRAWRTQPAHPGLTAREREVLELMSSGATNAQIADQLTVSESTVKSHVKHILRKLGASNRTEAIARHLHTTRQLDGWAS